MSDLSGSAKGNAVELLKEIQRERQQAAYARTGATLLVLLLLGTFVWQTYSRFTKFDTEAFMTSMQAEGAKKVWPLISRELDTLADAAVPALTKAFSDEIIAMAPRVQEVMGKESELLLKNMNERLASSLDAAIRDSKPVQAMGMKDEFPSFANDPQALEDLNLQLERAIRDWAHGQLDTTFQRHFTLLQSINETYTSLEREVRSGVSAGKEPASVEDVLTIFLEIVDMRLNPKGPGVPQTTQKGSK